MRLDEQLLRNYNELADNILSCYKDVAILSNYQRMQVEQSAIYTTFGNFNNHCVLLLQKDLALTVWKIYFDTNPNANTVRKFRNSINLLLRKLNADGVQVKKESINKKFEKTMLNMRKQFLAHCDMTREDSRLEISSIKETLDTIRTEFNNVCNAIDDENVKYISDIELEIIEMTYAIEMASLFK